MVSKAILSSLAIAILEWDLACHFYLVGRPETVSLDTLDSKHYPQEQQTLGVQVR